ncbi:MAG: YceK/YidQ family lipoprotein [Pseudomonadota bacterium]
MQVKTGLVWLVAALWVSGCATVTSLDSAGRRGPLVYSGTRLDLAAMVGDEHGLRRFNTVPPAYPWLDLPFSLVADTVIFPLTFAKAGGEWLISRRPF